MVTSWKWWCSIAIWNYQRIRAMQKLQKRNRQKCLASAPVRSSLGCRCPERIDALPADFQGKIYGSNTIIFRFGARKTSMNQLRLRVWKNCGHLSSGKSSLAQWSNPHKPQLLCTRWCKPSGPMEEATNPAATLNLTVGPPGVDAPLKNVHLDGFTLHKPIKSG